jgi:uncharacterized membrane protein YhhN
MTEIAAIALFFLVSLLNVYSSSGSKDSKSWLLFSRAITKILLVPVLFINYLVFAEQYDLLLVGALFFGWLGDISLEIPIHNKDNQGAQNIFFMIGLLFFLAGHILYSILFYRGSNHLIESNILIILLYLPYLYYCLNLYPSIFPTGTNVALKTGAVIYSLGLTLMSFAALTQLISSPRTGTLLIFIGSLFFVSSDMILSLKDIGQKKDIQESMIMGTYIAAQLLIVMGNILG